MGGPVIKSARHHSRRTCWACTKVHKVMHRYPEVRPANEIEAYRCEWCDATTAECKCDLRQDIEEEQAWMIGVGDFANDWCAEHQKMKSACCEPVPCDCYVCQPGATKEAGR